MQNRYRIALGKAGEERAAGYLQREAGINIIERNWETRLGEIDLIGRDKFGTLIFIEVKTRRASMEDAWEAVDQKKQFRMRRLALLYLKQKNLPLETPIRFDVVAALADGTIEHEADALEFEEEI